ncbi:MAG: SDR family oxidoreductase [Candidatus Humimicrobiaceae bacterium]|jgi:NAD(P)-dependent dehydrogenase (short-subunit alcohol dehydrogenase family)|nr:SDR family oxidoreductase [Candidatus Humimicrobiaceae bacterium]
MKNRYIPEFDLTGKNIIVTGAYGLIGKEICDAFSSAGANVIISDIADEKALKDYAEKLSCKHSTRNMGIYLDITDPESIKSGIENILNHYDGIDVLVNNAAIDAKFDENIININPTRFENYPVDELEKSMNVNITGTVKITKEVVKNMLKNKKGNIINVTSTYAIVAPDQRLYKKPGEENQTYKPVDYIITKSFIPGFTRYLAALYAKDGIRVNTIAPHGVYNNHDTDFVKRFSERSPLGRMCDLKELRGPFIFLASDASSYMTGSILVVDGGWSIW